MDSIQKDGLFWLPHNPGREVGGRLTFSPPDGFELHLFGSLRSNLGGRSHDSLPLLIHGVCWQPAKVAHIETREIRGRMEA